jgi:hypothetical protein
MKRGPEDAGRHEPPTKRSFYFSMATSTLRAIILVAALVVGVVLIKNAFPTNASQFTSSSPAAASHSNSSSSGQPSPRAGVSPTPQIHGVVVQVLNGTSTFGLANSTSQTLRSAGFDLKTPGNAALTNSTFIYYRPTAVTAANYLKDHYFQTAQVKPAPDSVPADVMVEVILGADYASSASSP